MFTWNYLLTSLQCYFPELLHLTQSLQIFVFMLSGPLLICRVCWLAAFELSVKQQHVWSFGTLWLPHLIHWGKLMLPESYKKARNIYTENKVWPSIAFFWQLVGGFWRIFWRLFSALCWLFDYCCDLLVNVNLSPAGQLAGFPGQASASIVMAATQTQHY